MPPSSRRRPLVAFRAYGKPRTHRTGRRLRPWPGGRDRGQASMEYIAVVAVVTLVLVVTATAVAAPGIVNGVGQGFQRALCRVTGEDCAVVKVRPCVVRTAGTDVNAGAKLTFFKLGATVGLLRSVRSDKTVTLTLLDSLDAGLTAGIGASGHLELGGVSLSGGAMAQVAAVARLGGGQTWKVKDAAAADRLQRTLIEVAVGRTGSAIPGLGRVLGAAQSLLHVGSGRDLPRPDFRTVKGGLSVSATFKGPLATDLKAAAGITLGRQQDERTGGSSFLVDLDAGASAALTSGLAAVGLGGRLGLQVVLDRHGRPQELGLTAAGQADGSLATTPGKLAGKEARELSTEITATLDLTVPAHLAAAKRVLRALVPGRRGDLLPAARALGDLVSHGARLERTWYGKRKSAYGAGAEAALGAGVGVDVEVTRADGKLLDAWTRPAGGRWERRSDCLSRA